MYRPALFTEPDTARLHALIDAYSFGTLIAAAPRERDDASGLEIAHLPFLLDRSDGPLGTLRTHVARANPIWRRVADGSPIVAVFAGPHGYVSPRWYAHPTEQVPTWNYAVVHAGGVGRAPLPRDELRELLGSLASRHESASAGADGAQVAWRPEDLAPALLAQLLDAVVGLALPIARLEGKFKLSQNRAPEDRDRVRTALAARGGEHDRAMSAMMAPRDRSPGEVR